MYGHEHALEFLALQTTKGREAGLACPLVLQSETKKECQGVSVALELLE